MIRLSDLWAPPWGLIVDGEYRDMKPLSLATFAALEATGVTLASLGGKRSAQAWLDLFCYLSGVPPTDSEKEKALASLLKDPLALKRFQETILDSIKARDEAKRQRVNKRTVKNPLEAKKTRDEDPEEEEPEEATDVSYLLMLSRISGIPLADLSRMSFRGVSALSKWLEENPPAPPMPMMPLM